MLFVSSDPLCQRLPGHFRTQGKDQHAHKHTIQILHVRKEHAAQKCFDPVLGSASSLGRRGTHSLLRRRIYIAELPVSLRAGSANLRSVPEDLNPAKYCSQRAFLVRMHERSVPLFQVRGKNGSSGIPQDGPRKLSDSMFVPTGKTTRRRFRLAKKPEDIHSCSQNWGPSVCVEKPRRESRDDC